MPAPRRHDKSLNRLLADIASRLAGSSEGHALLSADEFGDADPGCLGILCDAGLLTAFEPSATTICDGCDRACPMEVQCVPGCGASPSRAFIVCDKRDDIGRVPVEMDRLRRWRMSLDLIAETTATLLGTDRPPRLLEAGLVWSLGFIDHGNEAVEVILDATGGNLRPDHGLTVTLGALPEIKNKPIVELSRLVAFKGHRLGVDQVVLERVLDCRFDDGRVACEIRCERREIILLNHVTGMRRTIATPNFNSSNDNAFEVLYENPGNTYSLEKLRVAADEPTLADLHKIVQNLNFDGVLKKLFFDVSRDAIRFERTVTTGQLASLGIDPRAIA
ncbi:MAG: hypothetical protein O7H39_01960 [Gammaproteobacteria bacterium]|nr:hypothetical protein [Gammaproteobacteria bacterium]